MSDKNTFAVWRVVLAFFCYLIVFTFLFALLFSLIRELFRTLDTSAIFSFIFSLPIIGTLTLSIPALALAGGALSITNILCLKLTAAINKHNDLACAKTLVGVGIALLVIHVADILFNLYLGANVGKNIFPLINGIYLLIFGRRSHRDALSVSSATQPREQPSAQQNDFPPYAASAHKFVREYASRMGMSVPDYCRWSFKQEFLKEGFDIDTAKHKALAEQPLVDPFDESASIHAACSLVEHYAERMGMVVPQYLEWAKAQQRNGAQSK